MLSTGFYCGYTLKDSFVKDRFVLDPTNVFLMVLSIVLLMILVIINKEYYRFYDTELGDVIEEYKKRCADIK